MGTDKHTDKRSPLTDMPPKAVEPGAAANVQGGGRYNQAETLASSVEKKDSDTKAAISNKVG
jgi:hypothetical protein